jgi:DNA invertase Pin-like site-specific DNA recombinase
VPGTTLATPRLTIQILAAVAEHEARMISDRTKEALAAYKARGGLLGASLPRCRNLTARSRAKGATQAGVSHRKYADEAYSDLTERISDLRTSGMSLQKIAAQLTDAGYLTRRGRPWNPVQVRRVLARGGHHELT